MCSSLVVTTCSVAPSSPLPTFAAESTPCGNLDWLQADSSLLSSKATPIGCALPDSASTLAGRGQPGLTHPARRTPSSASSLILSRAMMMALVAAVVVMYL